MKKRGNRTVKSQKRTKVLFLILILAAIISITATYAWFSTQRDVEIVGFRINVETAENLEISLDGEHWTHTIEIVNMRQLYGTYTAQEDDPDIYQAKKDENKNYIPTELLPVSTVGNVSEAGNMLFAIGEVKDSKLSNVAKCSETDLVEGKDIKTTETANKNHPYLVFDMYLRNLSRLTTGGDQLQLNTGSYVSAASANTGLEYSVRVGFVQYGETVTIYESDDPAGTDGAQTLGEKIRGIEATGEETVSIWEPNSKFHIPFVVANDDRISSKIEAIDTYGIIVTEDDDLPATIDDIKDTDDEDLFSAIYTNKPTQAETETAIAGQIYQTTELCNLKQIDGSTATTLKPNAITKVRCYIWLEGQDPDCVDLASTGDEVLATIRLIKPQSQGGTNNSYADEEPEQEPEVTP